MKEWGLGAFLLASVISIGVAVVWWTQEANTSTQEDLDGQALYETQCAACHGIRGDGKGTAAYLLQPKPRRFRAGRFRLVSTDNGQPTREDLFRTLSEGMPGTGMPSWSQLSEEQRWSLVDYVLKLQREGWIEISQAEGESKEEGERFAQEMAQPGNPLSIPAEPEASAQDLAKGRKLYQTNCANCHGKQGEGMRDPSWRNFEGFPIWARDLRRGVFKGGRDSRQLYLRIAAGLPGTPMPAAGVTGEEIWHIVHYVQSLSDPSAQERALIRPKELTAAKRASLPSGPDDPAWEGVAEVRVPFLPLWWREGIVEEVRVRLAHDGQRVAFLLQWDDSTRDVETASQTRFPDGAAIQLSSEASPPLFAMGSKGHEVNIWHWKAAWEEDSKVRQGPETAFPRLTADAYYGVEKGWKSGPLEDNLFLPAIQLDNSVARTERPNSIEDDNAAGLGTLTPQAPPFQNVKGQGEWRDGVWRLQITRDLDGQGERDVKLSAGQASVAFAIWNGSAGDRNGQKAVSIWNTLRLHD